VTIVIPVAVPLQLLAVFLFRLDEMDEIRTKLLDLRKNIININTIRRGASEYFSKKIKFLRLRLIINYYILMFNPKLFQVGTKSLTPHKSK